MLTVVQETQSLSAVCFQVILPDGAGVVALVNPMSNAMATLATVTTGPELSAVQITNSDGSRQSLVPTTVPAGNIAAAASSLVQFVQIGATLPQDGSCQGPTSSSATAAADSKPGPLPAWSVSFKGGAMTYYEGPGPHGSG
jgi:hypothetical protein